MSLHAWLAFALVAVLVSLVPGPAVISVVSTALRGGFRASLATNAGVLAGDAVFVAAAALGLGALLVASHALFVAVKWLGIAYLAYLGVRALLDRGTAFSLDGSAGAVRHAFRLGLTTQLANPKVILFFGALLPQFVDPAHPAAPQFALLGATFIVSDLLVFAGYGALAHGARRALRSPRAARLTSRVTGAVMLGAAARLAAER
ncbi:MAG TPA: LysE family translocator [Candidatus Elarobacter sp.]|jgi:threonine/homoserine/homoserine lactone efflux protein|nr:LysE family translocator [Candidatus Elarobacter sp.]